ncbi:MAG: dihydrofolate reductase family protein [Myxococcota bacterium]
MAKMVYGMNVSLDGYVDHERFAPGPGLFRHWIEHVGTLTGSVYGRVLYELMQYWDQDDPAWSDDERAFARAWRAQPKWVVSRTLTSVGPNATLISGDVESALRDLKARLDGEIDVGGPALVGSLAGLGLIDEYRMYLHPVVLGSGRPCFPGPLPRLRLVSTELLGEDIVRLAYRPH